MASEKEVVVVKGSQISIPRRERARVGAQLNVRVDPALARRLRLFAAANDLLVRDCVEAGVRAVLGERAG
jgi:hypothetical protein